MFSTMSEQDVQRHVPRSETAQQHISIVTFETNLGWMAVAWSGELLEGVVFGYASRRLAERAVAGQPRLPRPLFRIASAGQADEIPPLVASLVDRLTRYAEGEPVDFSDLRLDTSHLTSFGRHVVAACRRIAWGQTRSYGDLAIECGSPGAARAVGSVMAKNRFPLVVPCHRVLAAGGALGGYSAPEGLVMKRRLLSMEAFGE